MAFVRRREGSYQGHLSDRAGSSGGGGGGGIAQNFEFKLFTPHYTNGLLLRWYLPEDPDLWICSHFFCVDAQPVPARCYGTGGSTKATSEEVFFCAKKT